MGLDRPSALPFFKFSQTLGSPWTMRGVQRKGMSDEALRSKRAAISPLSSSGCGADALPTLSVEAGARVRWTGLGRGLGDGGEAAPALKSHGYPGTSVRVTLHIWVPASGP